MKRLYAFLKAVCGQVFSSFVERRLSTEFPCADRLVQRRIDHQSDDPGSGNGVSIVGVL